jgi:hypothetical protein
LIKKLGSEIAGPGFPARRATGHGKEIGIVSLVVMDFVRAARLVEQVAAENDANTVIAIYCRNR